ncbi:uncharacterized protein LOC114448368 [Parambassis ranga]|uniref:Uncharacterized protein LOC114448368 n=1 Tax=Parambassis ranga TaxID=210632 RepID=A0A6P7JVY3_9TELE|nr:uncharacterized protein LOC114448368 [Parambassis ranga]
MSPAHSSLLLLVMLLARSAEGALYGYVQMHCITSFYDGRDAVYLEQYNFNKKLLMQYNSTVGKIVGYTERTIRLADDLNEMKTFLDHRAWLTNLCKKNIPLGRGLMTPVEPYVVLRSIKSEGSKHPRVLVCSVYNFYPKQIRVTWLRDGRETTSDVTSTDEVSDGNWLHQVHSYLEFTPTPGEKISCRVEHASLMRPKLYDWVPVHDWGVEKIAVGTAGVLLGLVFVVAGVIYYKMNSAVRVAVPTEIYGFVCSVFDDLLLEHEVLCSHSPDAPQHQCFTNMSTKSFLSLAPLLLLFFPGTRAHFGYGLCRCQLTSTHDVVYLEQIYMNKVLLGEYNSTSGKFVGYTEKAKEITDELNRSQHFLKQEKKNEAKCRTYVALAYNLPVHTVEPSIKLRSVKAADGKHPGMLSCSAYDFYPKQIKLTWLRDGKEETFGVTSTEELSNGNWFYQVHSFLEFMPTPGEKITCRVEHASLRKPMLYDWEPITESEKNKIAVGAAGLLLGLVIFLIGLIFYLKKPTGRMLVPTSYTYKTSQAPEGESSD